MTQSIGNYIVGRASWEGKQTGKADGYRVPNPEALSY